MRLYEFTILNEYKRDITADRLGSKLEQVTNEPIDQVLQQLESMDPTNHKQYTEWLARQLINKQFRLEDQPRVLAVMNQFVRAKNRLGQRDINAYTFRSLEDAMDLIYGTGVDTDEKAVHEVVPDSKVLYNGPLGQLVIPETEEASIRLGKGTKWCTARNDSENQFDYYSSRAPLYIWIDTNGSKYQFWFGRDMQFMDARDHPLSKEQLNYFRTQHPITKKLFAEKEKEFASNPKSAYFYASVVIEGPFPAGEKAIATSDDYSYLYAKKVIKGPWPPGEKAIASSAVFSYSYAKDVIKGPWPPGEKAIANDPGCAYYYAKDVIKGPWPPGEKAIASNLGATLEYAMNVIKGPWPPGEKAIASSPEFAYQYVEDVIKGPWPPGEEAIASDPYFANRYYKLTGVRL